MPPPPSFTHPVKRISDAVGLKAHAFADLIGVNYPTIHAVESATLKVSRSLAIRICAATGADPDTLVTPTFDKKPKGKKELGAWEKRTRLLKRKISSARPRDLAGRIYDRTSFEIHRRFDDQLANLQAQVFARRCLEVIFGAAAEERKFPAIYLSFCDWIDEAKSEAKLDSTMRRLAHSLPRIEKQLQQLYPSRKLIIDDNAPLGELAWGKDTLALGAAPEALPPRLSEEWRECYSANVKAAVQRSKNWGGYIGPLRILTEAESAAARNSV